MHGIGLGAERPDARGLFERTEVFQVGEFGRAEDLHPLDREITVEAGQREAGPVDRGFANPPLETDLRPLELHLQSLRVAGIKFAHGDGWMFGFGSGHWHLTLKHARQLGKRVED
jgi:hypothetical protein